MPVQAILLCISLVMYITIKRNIFFICQLLAVCLLSAQNSDVTIVTEPATNASGSNGKLMITLDANSSPGPYTVDISGPSGYTYNHTTSASAIVLSPLAYGDYTGKIINDNRCTAWIEARIKRCATTKIPGGGSAILCDELSTRGIGMIFYVNTYVSNLQSAPAINYHFNVFHSMPAYLYDQLMPSVQQTMTAEITKLLGTNYSAFEVFEQDEFPSVAPYVFSFNADGSLRWVYRNLM